MVVKHFQVLTFFSGDGPAGQAGYDGVRCWQGRRSAWKSTLIWCSRTAREPDYVDGEVVERALPTPIHSQIQALLILLFAPLIGRHQLLLLPELRVQIGPRRFRVVDLAVFRGARPEGRYATNPAFVVVEIISPDDRYGRLTHRLEDYRRWGVPHVWLVDPELKRLYEYSEAGVLQYPSSRLPEFDFEISAARAFQRRLAPQSPHSRIYLPFRFRKLSTALGATRRLWP